ncbi:MULTISPECIES: type II toxin-antitoxin system VapC family toxin [Rhizobium]|uniref:type II toxin-antitoxin system VapC family toxin n=1 Tax=Rhizobium TaxID=379 RepID=UPI001B319B47|nr:MULTISPECIES: type II toxin-antitoxin system VapC family toxin [Rhizobium]MBX4909830.1 type II toxin-antitoxin system VapC family toxin [Rhizobium bangladeshense]MBX5217613.1 type II toxin-antitoxin system VapC family toxin [Rhizobium sp. NLR9a]MBX5229073.1 type II toxin-antitoxin system VapC family toxin [Rhizobium sp. NLR9b]MBX5235496.1 type II toxin-antitoxin system VapC family toxin [Rhizobium sp. NLR4a]MBX5247654.1 type II toxin-antitoxin system VapC family toxin [Rhizobium sp. NLR3b]
MTFVLDASIAAAWFLPDEQHDAADRLMSDLNTTVGLVPTLFWFETRNLFLMAERRGRLRSGEAVLLMTQLRGLSLEDAGSGGDGLILHLANRYALTAYDASYVALAKADGLPLATADRKMADAARNEGITILGPLERREV